ncbi:MAG: hypothetical protein HYY35_00855 [Deltaproteobacteria bacterium]|nr:hypothetical protein [Deltaproteobacteria bacterium]
MSADGGIGGELGVPPAERPAVERRGPPKPHPAIFRCGLILMVASFALYPAYAVILVLPVSVATQAKLGIAAWAVSWGAFALGSVLALRGRSSLSSPFSLRSRER